MKKQMQGAQERSASAGIREYEKFANPVEMGITLLRLLPGNSLRNRAN